MPKMVLSSWPVISPSGNPLASRFLGAIKALQYYERWREGTEQLLTMWLNGAPASVETQIRNQMLEQGFEMWSRAGREILAKYALEGEPLQVLSRLSPPVSVLHVYCPTPCARVPHGTGVIRPGASLVLGTSFGGGEPVPYARGA